MIKKNLTPQVHKRHDLAWSSSDDEITGYQKKKVVKTVPGKGKVTGAKKNIQLASPKKDSTGGGNGAYEERLAVAL